MNDFPMDETLHGLAARIGALALRQRLGIESDREAQIFGQGRKFFHLENWYSIHSVIRSALRLSLLHGRGRRNALALRVRHNRVSIPALPPAFEGFTLLHLSDLHLDMNAQLPRVLSEAVAGLRYDACVLTGDYRAKTFGSSDAALAGLQSLAAALRGPAYAVLGNHDSIRMVPAMEALGLRVLLNESTALERSGAAVHLVGIDDPHYYRADNLERAIREVPPGQPAVLLSHSPEMYRHAAHAGFDLMLCGHTHGGQICLPGGRPLLCNARAPRRMCAGPWQYHRMAGYTSVGSGVSIVDVRLNCRPEVTLHRLHAAQ